MIEHIEDKELEDRDTIESFMQVYVEFEKETAVKTTETIDEDNLFNAWAVRNTYDNIDIKELVDAIGVELRKRDIAKYLK